MGAEEDVGGLEGGLRDAIVVLQEKHDPRGIAVLQTVTVGAIPHELAIVNLAQLVYLPIDDGIILGTTKAVAPCSVYHLAVGEHTGLYYRATETTLGA